MDSDTVIVLGDKEQTMMYEEDIQKVDGWFDRHTENYGTSRSETEYSIDSYDLEDFSRFLGDEFPGLCYIRCYFGTGDSTIWFFREDLEKAVFY